MTAHQLVLATRNPKKMAELRRILQPVVGLDVLGLDDLPPYEEAPESGATFGDNALSKARDGTAKTGLPCVADDSGLTVEALNGMPGVLSARWSGRHGDDQANIELLLGQIVDVPDERRGAAFVCAAALVLPGGEEHVLKAEMRGTIIRQPKGSGGFGYDPIFVAEGQTMTTAELTPEAKDAISHRGKAFRALTPIIATALTGAASFPR